MKRYAHIILFLIVLLLMLPGCSMVISGSEVSTVEPGAAGQPVESLATPQATATEASRPEAQPPSEELRPIAVEHVQILSGYASLIPALVAVSGTWPDLCAQLAQVSQPVIQDFQIEMALLATAADPGCPPDNVGLPFSMKIPINWMELAEGAYTVTVNGQQTTLHVPVIPPSADPETGAPVLGVPLTPTPGAAPEAETPARAVEAGGEQVPVPLEAVQVQVGVGSPIPVEVAVAAGWPSLCAQLAEISQKADGFQIDITILAHPGRPDCPPDNVGYGFGLNVPINVLELPEGTYTVTVNGMSTTFKVPVNPPAVEPETGQPRGEATALCPEIARPALLFYVPGDEHVVLDAGSGARCELPNLGSEALMPQVGGNDLFYAVREEDRLVVHRLRPDGTEEALPTTAVSLAEEPGLSLSFTVSDDGSMVAWNVFGPGDQAGDVVSDLFVAPAGAGEDIPATALASHTASGQPRAFQPIRFSEDGSIFYYALQPHGVGGSWVGFVGRYDTLYAVATDGSGAPELIFDCAELGLGLCLGDFFLVDGAVSALAYVDHRANTVVVQNGEGQVLNTIQAEEEFVGYPTWGPGGELVYYTADLSDDPDAGPMPEMGVLRRVAPPTAPPEVLASDRGLLPPQGWLDATHVVTGYHHGGGSWGLALVGVDGSLQVLQSEPNASFIDVLPAPAE